MQCTSDKHNFTKGEVYSDGTLYKCDKCGLETRVPTFSGTIYEKFFGSYIGGISHKWSPSDMRAEDIVSFAISFGDLPIVTIRYDGTVMKVKNSINGSRDGWRSFPKGYFDEKTIKLSDEDKKKIHECLRSLDFDSFTTSPDLFRNFGAAGFCIRNSFACRFSNGKGFECLSPRCDGFNILAEVMKSIIRAKSEPVCGKTLRDGQKTGWLCAKCGAANKFDYKFCSNCGKKRPWRFMR